VYGCWKVMVWYCDCALPVPSFSWNAWNGVLAVPLFGGGALPAPKPPVVLEPKPPVVVFALVDPKPLLVLPPPNRPPLVVVEAPKPVAGLAWPKRPPPVSVLLAPKAEVVLLFDAPKPPPPPPNALPPEAPPPPKRPPPVVELPKGCEPKVVLGAVLAPKPPVGKVSLWSGS